MQSKILWILILGIILRVINLNQSLWLDEATSVKAAQLSFFDIVTKFSPGDFHPPLYYLLLKGWGSIVGFGEVQVRSLSILFGLGAVFVIFLIGKLIKNEKTGLTASLLLATSPLHIYYSQEARMYSLSTFLTTLAFFFFLKILRHENIKNYWVWFTLSVVFLGFTNYLPLLFIVTLGLYLAIFEKKHLTNNKEKWLKSTFAMGILLIAWLPIFLSQIKIAQTARENASIWVLSLGKTTIRELLLIPIKFMIGRISFYNKILYAIFIIPPTILFGWALLNSKSKILWFVFVVPILLAALFGFFFSGFSYFRLIFLLPVFYLLVAIGIVYVDNIKSKKYLLTGIILVNMICSFVYLLNPRFYREDWKGAVSWVEENSKTHKIASIFVAKHIMDPYNYYTNSNQGFGPMDLMDNSYDKIYLFRYVQPVFDREDNLKKKIELLGYKKEQEKDFNGVVVWEYKK